MKRLLILLTSVYPTSTGDMFVHEELDYLVRDFSTVLLFPVNATGKQGARVSQPEGCMLHLTNPRGKLAASWRDLRYMLKPSNWQAEDMAEERESRAKSLKHHLYLLYAQARADQVCRDAMPIIADEIERVDYDEVTVYSYWMSVPARAALLIRSKLAETKPTYTLRSFARGHGYDIYDEASRVGYQPFRRALIQRMDALYPCSTYGVRYMEERYMRPGEERKIYLARLGIEDPLRGRGRSRDSILALRRAKPGRLHLVTCARVAALKRLPLLIDALALLQTSGIDVFWTHFGSGADYDAVRAYAEEKLGSMTWDMRGFVPIGEILDYYLSEPIDLFLNVSSTEGVPVSMMEAMACYIPVYSTDVGGVSEIVMPQRSGLLWPADVTAETIKSDLLQYAVTDQATRLQAAEEARAIWQERSDASTNYKQISQVLSGKHTITDIPFSYTEDKKPENNVYGE